MGGEEGWTCIVSTSEAEARIAETLACTVCSSPLCSEAGSSSRASWKRDENQP